MNNNINFENVFKPSAFFSYENKVMDKSIIRFGNIDKLILTQEQFLNKH
jgi:hypothetical protein